MTEYQINFKRYYTYNFSQGMLNLMVNYKQ